MFRKVQHQTTVKCWFTQIHQNQRTAVNCSIWTIYWFNLWITKRVFEPKTKHRKPLETLGFGNFGGFGKYKVQKTSPSLIWWNRCDSSIFDVPTDPIIGTHWDGSMTKLRRVIAYSVESESKVRPINYFVNSTIIFHFFVVSPLLFHRFLNKITFSDSVLR